MFRFASVSLFAFFFLLLCFARQTPSNSHWADRSFRNAYQKANSIYEEAERLSGTKGFSDELQDSMNKKALLLFRPLLTGLDTQAKDSISGQLLLKTAILEHYFGNLLPASQDYKAAIASMQHTLKPGDSLFFKPYLYLGNIFYLQDQFDSAMIFYKKAEEVANRYAMPVNESERLYNTFGNIYLSAGNFRQSKNYFEKAIGVLKISNPYYEALLVNYKINLATALIKLEEYQKADSIYRSVLQAGINTNDILHHLGIIRLYLGQPRQALALFRQVKAGDYSMVRVYNDMATAQYNLGRFDSAHFFLDKAMDANVESGLQRKNGAHGTSFQELGKVLLAEKKFEEAAKSYQEAIIQFDPAFNDPDPSVNPDRYGGIFSYIGLFEALTAKANALMQQHASTHHQNELKNALAAYRSAFMLSDYVARTYDSDEARLFLEKIKYTVHGKPIEICLQLYQETKDRSYLEEAFAFDQQNKASVLSLSVQENAWKNERGNSLPVFRAQSSLKSSITRLSLKASGATDSATIANINEEVRDDEIKLTKIQDTINNDPSLARFRSLQKIPAITDIQTQLLDDRTAILSYHLSEKELTIFGITRNAFEFAENKIDSSFYEGLAGFITQLHSNADENKYTGHKPAMQLYRQLITPLAGLMKGMDRIIVIPDDELNTLPFEALENDQGEFLLSSFAIQYQYSTALLADLTKQRFTGQKVLALAPFTSSGYVDSIKLLSWSRLSATANEIKDLSGRILKDKEATKQAFLANANHYPIIHLATHASVNENEPGNSYIVFYPSAPGNLLYAKEIYDIRLDSTSLVILSACETGSGRLVKGEGMMSLSRAIAYAGCPNIITSLWKADDFITAYITRRLHQHLERGLTRDQALRTAKLQLLADPAIDTRFKTPNYWAHLILIDNYEPSNESRRKVIWILSIIAALLFGLLAFRRIKRKSPPQ